MSRARLHRPGSAHRSGERPRLQATSPRPVREQSRDSVARSRECSWFGAGKPAAFWEVRGLGRPASSHRPTRVAGQVGRLRFGLRHHEARPLRSPPWALNGPCTIGQDRAGPIRAAPIATQRKSDRLAGPPAPGPPPLRPSPRSPCRRAREPAQPCPSWALRRSPPP
jgi:hypothetical protein